MTNLRTGLKRSERNSKSGGRNSVRRTGSSGGSSRLSRRSDSSFEGTSPANLAELARLASFSREVAAMAFPTMAERRRRRRRRRRNPDFSFLGFGMKREEEIRMFQQCGVSFVRFLVSSTVCGALMLGFTLAVFAKRGRVGPMWIRTRDTNATRPLKSVVDTRQKRIT